MIEKLLEEKIVAVLRGKDHDEIMLYVDAIIEGKINAIELTYSIPNVLEFVGKVKEKYPFALIGMGSVLNEKMAIDAINAGCSYIVSPGFSPKVSDVCKNKNMLYLPGCMTATEIMNAMDHGHEYIKLFPGDIFSPGYIKSILAPIPNVKIMVTGGVDVDNVKEWFANGVVMVGVGSSLQKPGTTGDFNGVKILAEKFKENING
ncbi:MAG: bifunctional 4-hydroxy-2-oxoglutarate aldolase/2-dehydro-3-deoxy-phosphogluconate aldolase [Mycoplasmatales bacterium]